MTVLDPETPAGEAHASGGMRERKRRATRNSIQRAVLTLSLERGFERITVEEISQSAGVSPRTFFNYFPTKEAAVIGDVPTLPQGEVVERFLAAAPQPILDGIRDLLLAGVDELPDPDDVEIERLRRMLLRDHPSLFTARMTTMKQFETDLAALVERRLANDDDVLVDDPEQRRCRARLITYVAFAGIRHAWMSWAENGGGGTLADRLASSFSEMREVVAGG